MVLFLCGDYSRFRILSSCGYILTHVLFSFWYILM
nr:MAG TPA: BM2 protein [Caudoviricetes sp.]